MITLADRAQAERVRRLANHGRADKYLHSEEGFNYRLDALQAAVLRVKLSRLESWKEERRRAARLYDERLKRTLGFQTRIVPFAQRNSETCV